MCLHGAAQKVLYCGIWGPLPCSASNRVAERCHFLQGVIIPPALGPPGAFENRERCGKVERGLDWEKAQMPGQSGGPLGTWPALSH